VPSEVSRGECKSGNDGRGVVSDISVIFDVMMEVLQPDDNQGRDKIIVAVALLPDRKACGRGRLPVQLE
jgi:hypothetical protein